MNRLLAVLEGREIATITRTGGRLRFTYDDAWRATPGAFPLSLSMPLAAAEHPHAVIEPFLWGLLPDNELVLHRWARRFHVSPRSAFSLLTEVGEDCAGAVQFVRPERLRELAEAPACRMAPLRTGGPSGPRPCRAADEGDGSGAAGPAI